VTEEKEEKMNNEVPFEPFRIKTIEPIPITSRAERVRWLHEADYNLFRLRAEQVTIDLLTDSGTGAMSAAQWGAMLQADESYAGARSFYRLQEAVRDITGMPLMVPTHQGRAAEQILCHVMLQVGSRVPSNQHFDTTGANIEAVRAHADELVIEEAHDPQNLHPFKGNMDLDRLAAYVAEHRGNIPLACLTLTNNSGGGQPVSLANVRAVSALLRREGIPFFLDIARYAENCYFIQQREAGQEGRAPIEIAREIFSLADGCWMSAKKDGLVNIGGFIALHDSNLYDQICQRLILTEGFPTYGGMAGYSMEALAVGLYEGLDEHYLAYRIAQAHDLGARLKAGGVPILEPVGGHAVYIDARRFLPAMPQSYFPAQAISVAMYIEGGVRTVEIGSVMFGRSDEAGSEQFPALDLVRLTLPRRTYTSSHLNYVADVGIRVYKQRSALVGLRITQAPPALRHFTAYFAQLEVGE